MDIETKETLYFHYCRTLDGRPLPVDVARRNGRLVLRFSSEHFDPQCVAGETDNRELEDLITEVTQNLTAIEQRTWLQVVDGVSVLDLAAAEGVSRAAIYDRIRGNTKGQGGMASKNPYVAIWWRLRQARENTL